MQSGEGYGVLRLMFLSTDKENTEEYKGKSSWDGGVGGNGRKEGLYRKVRINSLVMLI